MIIKDHNECLMFLEQLFTITSPKLVLMGKDVGAVVPVAYFHGTQGNAQRRTSKGSGEETTDNEWKKGSAGASDGDGDDFKKKQEKWSKNIRLVGIYLPE